MLLKIWEEVQSRMKIVFISNNNNKYSDLQGRLRNETGLDVEFEYAARDKVKFEKDNLYVLEASHIQDMVLINKDFNFIVLLQQRNVKLAYRAYKCGALDLLMAPYTEDNMYVKIKRYVTWKDRQDNKEVC